MLEGTLTLLIEGEATVLDRGELIRVGPEVAPPARQPRPGATRHCSALGGSHEHEGRDGEAFASVGGRAVARHPGGSLPDLPDRAAEASRHETFRLRPG